MREIHLPQLAIGGEDATISGWLKRPGDPVSEGETIVEVETDKASMEVEATHAGVLVAVLADVGQRVAPGTVIAILADADEEIDATVVGEQASAPARSAAVAPPPQVPAPLPAGAPATHERPDVVVRHGELGGVPRRPALVSASELAAAGPVEEREINRRRAAIARRLSIAARIPTFTVTRDVDVGRALARIARVDDAEARATLTDALLLATAAALAAEPEFNAWFDGRTSRIFTRVNIALAVDASGGVVAPVLTDLAQHDLRSVAHERASLVRRARTGDLVEADLAGATFTLSNLGSHEIDSFSAVLTPPQVAVLAIGRARPASGTQLVTATLTVDHRILDGADGARFLAAFAAALESPRS